MKNKIRFLVISLAAFLGLAGGSVPAMAATPDVIEKAPEGEISEEKKAEPITPDGNLTLVDDFGEHETSGKQFITLVTRDGNYFYLIIDRDDEGKETVHFLNQVDEADLFALLDEEELEGLEEKKPEGILEEEILTEGSEECILPEKPVEESVKEKSFPIGAIISGVIVIGGCAGFAALKVKEKRRQQEQKEEPKDEEEYYEFMELEQELNGEGLDDEESI